MSSDAFADLARSVGNFADSLRELLERNSLPARGSPAAAEIDSEPFAGEWGKLPSATAFAIVLLTAAACADHLSGVSAVISTRRAKFAPYVLTRAAAEAASVCCYVADPAADTRERLRRSMNLRLDGMCERLIMLRSVTSIDATREIAHTEERVAAFGRAAVAHGFAFHKADGRGRPAYLDDKLPAAMKLMDACASDTPGLGIAYQRLLSAVTHGKLHGLSRFLMAAETPDRNGRPEVELNVPARTLALELLAGPLCASEVVERLAGFTGWDTDDMRRPVVTMLDTWGRIARVPYRGPTP